MSRAEQRKSSLYYLLEDFFVSLLVGAAMAAVLVMIGGSAQAVLATALGGPGVYFLGQRWRRFRSRRSSHGFSTGVASCAPPATPDAEPRRASIGARGPSRAGTPVDSSEF